MQIIDFKKIIWNYYKTHKRDMPWRKTTDPYKIFVSEIMLQQTQVNRVITKYNEFIAEFPDFASLASVPIKRLLMVWQGMGYNRRALYMRSAAAVIVDRHKGILPKDPMILVTLPGIGKATAGSLAAFAYNLPTVFIETNIRRVFIHHFFPDKDHVHDSEILPLVQESIDRDNPREWYYALMDYGSQLVKKEGNSNKRSKHYSVQSKFEGSDRQLRGKIIRKLIEKGNLNKDSFHQFVSCDRDRGIKIIAQLEKEGFVREVKGEYMIK